MILQTQIMKRKKFATFENGKSKYFSKLSMQKLETKIVKEKSNTYRSFNNNFLQKLFYLCNRRRYFACFTVEKRDVLHQDAMSVDLYTAFCVKINEHHSAFLIGILIYFNDSQCMRKF